MNIYLEQKVVRQTSPKVVTHEELFVIVRCNHLFVPGLPKEFRKTHGQDGYDGGVRHVGG